MKINAEQWHLSTHRSGRLGGGEPRGEDCSIGGALPRESLDVKHSPGLSPQAPSLEVRNTA